MRTVLQFYRRNALVFVEIRILDNRCLVLVFQISELFYIITIPEYKCYDIVHKSPFDHDFDFELCVCVCAPYDSYTLS